VGTKTPFNFGSYIFEQTLLHAKSTVTRLPIAFPTVLCGIILSQHPNIIRSSDVLCKREAPLTFDCRFLEGPHEVDIAVPSATPSGVSMSRRQMIADLQDVSKVLGDKKLKVDRVIEALMLEEKNIAASSSQAPTIDTVVEDSEGSLGL
jgi:hypothetical protein